MLAVQRNSEKKLLEMVQSLKDASAGYYGVHFHFSELQTQYRSEYQIKIAVNIITDTFKGQDGVVFVCKDNDLFMLYHGVERTFIEKAVFQLRYLFMDDPLAYNDEGFENEDFASVYDLEFQAKEFLNLCRRKVVGGDTRDPSVRSEILEKRQSKSVGNYGDRHKMQLFQASHLANIESDIRVTDIGPALRSQPVCAFAAGKPAKPVFEEVYVHIAHLRKMMRLDVDFLSSRPLFKHLTEILDKRVLNLMNTQPTQYFKVPMSLNLNIKSLITEEFAAFDAMVPAKFKTSVIVEVHIADVFEDISTFMIACKAVQKLGYRVCLDGLNSLSFKQIDRELLGVDMVKLQWNPEMQASNDDPENILLRQKVQQFNPHRVILCWCDNDSAISYGHALGISLFQGRYLDRIVNPSAKVTN